MIHFDPPVSIKPLSDVEPGSIVRWEEGAQRIGFCIVGLNDPRKVLAVYDSETCRFNWLYAEVSDVVSYGNQIIVRPDVESFAPGLTAKTDGTLYTLEGSPHLLVAVNNAMRFLNLATGEIKSRQSWPMMSGYRNWTAGVYSGPNNQFVELLSISQSYGTDDEGSIDPDRV